MDFQILTARGNTIVECTVLLLNSLDETRICHWHSIVVVSGTIRVNCNGYDSSKKSTPLAGKPCLTVQKQSEEGRDLYLIRRSAASISSSFRAAAGQESHKPVLLTAPSGVPVLNQPKVQQLMREMLKHKHNAAVSERLQEKHPRLNMHAVVILRDVMQKIYLTPLE